MNHDTRTSRRQASGRWRRMLQRTALAGALVAGSTLLLLPGLEQSLHSSPATRPSRTVPQADATPARQPSRPATATTQTAPPGTTSARPRPVQRVSCAKVKCVALTFDDGPVAGTGELLALLRAKRVKATFFVLGSQAARHPGLIRRMAMDGHTIGNHSWSHPQLTRLSTPMLRRQLTRTNETLRRAGAVEPVVFRPPYGATDARVRSVAGALGMSEILWDVDPLDWRDRSRTVVGQRVVAATRNGSIVLAHDVHPTTRAACAAIIDRLRARGFHFVTVPELLGKRMQAGSNYRSRTQR